MLVQASDTEGTPRTVIEAMARRVPVVATCMGDVAELLGYMASAACWYRLAMPTRYRRLSTASWLIATWRTRSRSELRLAIVTIEVVTCQVESCYEAAIRIAAGSSSEG